MNRAKRKNKIARLPSLPLPKHVLRRIRHLDQALGLLEDIQHTLHHDGRGDKPWLPAGLTKRISRFIMHANYELPADGPEVTFTDARIDPDKIAARVQQRDDD